MSPSWPIVDKLSTTWPTASPSAPATSASTAPWAALPAPRRRDRRVAALAAELAERVDADLERGFTGHGPHRDELVLAHDGRELRAYGSQGQQRLALLALLLAEREAVGEARGALPLMLLDDVMSELDADRRRGLVDLLRAGGQSVITTTDLAHVPTAEDADVARLRSPTGPSSQDARRREARGAAPLSQRSTRSATDLAPQTPLARVQSAWAEAVGERDRRARRTRVRSGRGRHRALRARRSGPRICSCSGPRSRAV